MRTTIAHFKLFKAECEKWIKIWGLLDWSVDYAHEDIDGCKGQRSSGLAGKVATLSLATDWGDDNLTNYQIKKTAFHEVAELLLAEIHALGDRRFVAEERLETARHTVIRRLENVVFEGLK